MLNIYVTKSKLAQGVTVSDFYAHYQLSVTACVYPCGIDFIFNIMENNHSEIAG